MFRRRRYRGQHGTGREPGESYPAEDELAEVDYPDGDEEYEEFEEEEEEEEDDQDEAETVSAEDDAAESGPAGQSPGAGRPGRDDLGDPATWTRLRDPASAVPAMARSAGPWDSATDYPQAERIDFGSLLVPVRDGYDVQVFVSEEEGISIAVVRQDSALQLQPFAAPRSSGLWDEVRPEIAEEVAKAGGQSIGQEGPFGQEVLARVSPQDPAGQPMQPQPLRFIGVDGPRWFLRGLISGPAATDGELAGPLEEIFADVVVVRGEHAVPARSPLEIRLPDEAREVLEDQLQQQDRDPLNPFERGPEITETR